MGIEYKELAWRDVHIRAGDENLIGTQSPYRYLGTLRFVLALAVVVGHYQASLTPHGLDVHADILGSTGVFIFFVLSGFVVTEAFNLFYNGRIKQFLINRSLRIIPPFFVAMVLGVFTYALFAYFRLPHLELNNQYLHVLGLKSILSNLSCPLYLNHFTVQFHAYTTERSWVIFSASLIVAVTTSYFAYVAIEPYLARIRERIRGRAL